MKSDGPDLLLMKGRASWVVHKMCTYRDPLLMIRHSLVQLRHEILPDGRVVRLLFLGGNVLKLAIGVSCNLHIFYKID